MIKINKEVIINAPVENVFNYIKEPTNLSEIWPGLMSVYNIEILPNGGYSVEYDIKIAGMIFKGKGVYTEYIPNQRIAAKTKGISFSFINAEFKSIDKNTDHEKTYFSVTIEYEAPIPVLGKLAEYIIMKMNDQEADLVMSNLKTRFS